MSAGVDLVVVGLGYVGLPLAREACRAGLAVAGLDTDASVVAGLLAGRSHVGDVGEADVAWMLASGFRPTGDDEVLAGAGAVVLCVPTPLTPDGAPDLTAVRAACTAVAARLRPGTLVVLESTTYPGTTEEVVAPLLETSGLRAGADFPLAFSPERVDPGNAARGVRVTPKVVGGLTPACGAAAAEFYGKFVASVHLAKGAREAEMAKLLENTYRHVNIALVNELTVLCRELGVDPWDVIDSAATKPFGFQPFHPGPGVGGHCIAVDPYLLSHRVRALGHPFRLVEAAQEVNSRMPGHVVERAAALALRHGVDLAGERVLLCGVTYKADVADLRETPATPVARLLRDRGAEVAFHDPHVAEWSVDDVPVPREPDLVTGLRACALTIVVTHHRAFAPEELAAHSRLLLDTRGGMRPWEGDALEVL
ncbi:MULTISPECIES: nucleotide sugar dehydrogenase [Actinosynnema]|uniref:nucleotide sugar dehydrogenase n=1 Tax=Actinosynnema TaxID=40566 RepID=UPI0020A2B457|nr:nucleotide sugar dehydrogenase [Actinosynnema pretiosum]MCP2098814.1 nucleotide sugar dehydrogenase [Actinosynnema pretiosum]